MGVTSMATERKPVDISDIHSGPELLRIVEELRETKESQVITHQGEEVAVLRPIRHGKPAARPRRKTGIMTDHPLWNIVGIGQSAGPGDVSENKHKYLSEDYADLHE
jgi:hypothetical protein